MRCGAGEVYSHLYRLIWSTTHRKSPYSSDVPKTNIWNLVCSLSSWFCLQHQLFSYSTYLNYWQLSSFSYYSQTSCVILDSSFFRTPCPVYQQILLSLPSKSIQKLTTSNHLHCQSTLISHQDYFNNLLSWIPSSTLLPCSLLLTVARKVLLRYQSDYVIFWPKSSREFPYHLE